MASLARGIAVLALAGFGCTAVRCQVYPKWFLDQVDLPCAGSTAGVAVSSYYPDSSGGQAFLTAVENRARELSVTIKGTKEYLSTETGTMVVSTSVTESFDTSAVEPLKKSTKKIAEFAHGPYSIVLVGGGGCSLPHGLTRKVSVDSLPVPAWVEAPPQDDRYVYASGVSETCFYEASAWAAAEKNARLELARSLSLHVRGEERFERFGNVGRVEFSVRDESIALTLRNVRVLRRWRDTRLGVYYVLIGLPR